MNEKGRFNAATLARNDLLWGPMPSLGQWAARDEPPRSAGPAQSHVLIAARRSKGADDRTKARASAVAADHDDLALGHALRLRLQTVPFDATPTSFREFFENAFPMRLDGIVLHDEVPTGMAARR
jgi:hypothetical protein